MKSFLIVSLSIIVVCIICVCVISSYTDNKSSGDSFSNESGDAFNSENILSGNNFTENILSGNIIDDKNENSGNNELKNIIKSDELGSYFVSDFDYKKFIIDYYLLDMIYQKTGQYLTNEEINKEYENTFYVVEDEGFLICNDTLKYEKTKEGYTSNYIILFDDIKEYLK